MALLCDDAGQGGRYTSAVMACPLRAFVVYYLSIPLWKYTWISSGSRGCNTKAHSELALPDKQQ